MTRSRKRSAMPTSLPDYLRRQAFLYRLEQARAKSRKQLVEELTFTDFKRAIFKRYLHAPHLEALDRMLMDVMTFVQTAGAQGTGRGMIFMPPRHGKSLTTSRLFPPFFFGHNPDMRIILASYGATLAEKHSRAARNIMASPVYTTLFPQVQLAPDSKSVAAWDIARREGGMDALGVGGGVTGKGANLIIIDDPVKGRAEAASETISAMTWDWFTNDIYTRLEPGGAVIVSATRWDKKDLMGRLLSNVDAAEWSVLRLPALAEDGDPLGRKPGSALWPERFDEADLLSIRTMIGAFAFAALYQQNPQPREGSLFQWEWFDRPDFRIETLPKLDVVVVAVDPAVSSGEDSDETGIVVVARAKIDGAWHGFVLADLSLRGTPDTWATRAVAAWRTHRAARIVVEDNQGGEMTEHTLRTIDKAPRIKRVRAKAGKMLRAEPIAALYEQGRIHHVGVFTELEDQMCSWLPGDVTSPDRLDALVHGLTDLLLGPTGVGFA